MTTTAATEDETTTASDAPRFACEEHPNLGYIVFADWVHVGSVQRLGSTWFARSDYSTAPTLWPTRVAASRELHRVAGSLRNFPADAPEHKSGRIGCNHAGGRCSEVDADDVGHD